MLTCVIFFCVHSCDFSFNSSFSYHDTEIVDFWCTCPVWIAFAGVLVKRLVFSCRYCYVCVTYWASRRLVNCFHSMHEMGRICFKILDWYIVPFNVWDIFGIHFQTLIALIRPVSLVTMFLVQCEYWRWLVLVRNTLRRMFCLCIHVSLLVWIRLHCCYWS